MSIPTGMTGSVEMRAACRNCGSTAGEWRSRNGQLPVFCADCGVHAQYNVPHVAAGVKPNTPENRPGLSASRRARILDRDGGRCALCGRAGQKLHVSHVVSRRDALEVGFDAAIVDRLIDSDDNLAAFCQDCNLGLGKSTVSPATYLTIVAVRLQAGGDA